MFTYAEVGATRYAPLPEGYHHLSYATVVGEGAGDFAAAGEAVLTWRAHRATGAGITAPRAAVDVDVTVRLGPFAAPCRVVWAVEEERRAGFGYGTLPGHPECGEESFVVDWAEDGRVWFTVTAFSRPARWYTRLAGPVVPVVQNSYARLLGRSVRRLVAAGR